MNIAYIGNFLPFWSTESHIALSLEELGHTVARIQENQYTAEEIAPAINEWDADLLLWTRTWGVRGDGMKMLKSIKCPSAAYHLDLYAGLARNGNIDADPWWKCDFVFSADGGSAEYFKEHGVNHFWSPPGVYGKECYLAEPVDEYRSEVLFCGSYGYHPEWPYRQQLINNLRKHYGARFKHIDHNSEGAPWRGHKLNQLYASAKVIVGDSLCLGFNHPNYWSDRVLETPGRGGFLIHPYITGITKMFEPYYEMMFYTYDNFDELYSRIGYYLDHDEDRERLKLAAHERTKREHTYANRLSDALETIKDGVARW